MIDVQVHLWRPRKAPIARVRSRRSVTVALPLPSASSLSIRFLALSR